MLHVESFTLGPIMTNAYLLYNKEQSAGIVIDPGSGPEALIHRIQELDLSIAAILLTHAHFDHIGGLEAVRKATGAKVYIHHLEQDWLTDARFNGSGLFPGIAPIVCQPAEQILQGNETLSLLGASIRVIHTPGHSPGSVTFILDNRVFSGDVLFAGSIGRTDLPGGDYETLLRSIQETLMGLPEETLVYSGHGPQTTIGKEQGTNPYLTGR